MLYKKDKEVDKKNTICYSIANKIRLLNINIYGVVDIYIKHEEVS